ncbi:MAG: hypothetical protein HC809_10630 [Gammaproteobacteria bacterium]|nr:hypothetical protein [Gammaproteobacteria bacterium]
MTITFVKKILADGSPCGKCADVEARLTSGNHWSAIDRTVVADERDPNSEGMRLAAEFGVDRAPFFVVESAEETVIYTVFLKFVRDVLSEATTAAQDAEVVLRSHPDLDFL